jgi:hypothetical protein
MLPTYAEAMEVAALDYAKRLNLYFAENSSPWSREPIFSPEAGRAMTRMVIGRAMLDTATGRLALIAAAEGGDRDAAAVLAEVIREAKSRRSWDTLPVEVQAYDLHDAGIEDRRRERQWKKYATRDLAIAIVVAAIVDRYGMRPTGRSARQLSACQIEAIALVQTGLYPKIFVVRGRCEEYKNIERVWSSLRNAMPTQAGWSRDFEPWVNDLSS